MVMVQLGGKFSPEKLGGLQTRGKFDQFLAFPPSCLSEPKTRGNFKIFPRVVPQKQKLGGIYEIPPSFP